MKWLEDNTNDLNIKNKLYYIRITRNYIQHNNDYKDFIIITDGMLKFLDEILLYVKNQITQAKDEMLSLNKITKATNKDKASDILNIMIKKKLDLIPINEDNIYFGMINIYELIAFVLENKNKTIKHYTKTKQKSGYKLVKCDILMEEIEKIKDENTKYIFCTDTGNSKGKILGIFIF